MLGRQHANLGATGFLAIGYGVQELVNRTALSETAVGDKILEVVNPVSLAFFVCIATACALVPDFDGKKSIISQRFPFTGRFLRIFFRKHRGFSHTIFSAMAFGIFGLIVESLHITFTVFDHELTLSKVLMSIILIGSVSLAVPFIMPFNVGWSLYYPFIFAVIGVGIMLNFTDIVPPYGLGITMFIGVMLHSVGDSLTPSGVAWLYPLTDKKLSIPINGRTGGDRELRITRPFLTITATAMIIIAIVIPLIRPYTDALFAL